MRSRVGFLVWSLVQNFASLVLTVVLTCTTVLTVGLTGLAAARFAEAADQQRMRAIINEYLRTPGAPSRSWTVRSSSFGAAGHGAWSSTN